MQASYGLLMYVPDGAGVCVLLVHPGGPYWGNKDIGAWSIPKGLADEHEDGLAAAQREFFEETGLRPRGPFIELKPVRQKGGKLVHCWAFEGERAPVAPGASTFEIEWPPRSGQRARFPEVDRAEFFTLAEARKKILASQLGFLDQLAEAERAARA
jgi:predicted NUDIX family NTP pyrophosphohydrolase